MESLEKQLLPSTPLEGAINNNQVGFYILHAKRLNSEMWYMVKKIIQVTSFVLKEARRAQKKGPAGK